MADDEVSEDRPSFIDRADFCALITSRPRCFAPDLFYFMLCNSDRFTDYGWRDSTWKRVAPIHTTLTVVHPYVYSLLPWGSSEHRRLRPAMVDRADGRWDNVIESRKVKMA